MSNMSQQAYLLPSWLLLLLLLLSGSPGSCVPFVVKADEGRSLDDGAESASSKPTEDIPWTVLSCGGCTWSLGNGNPSLLIMVGASDCGSGCPTTLSFLLGGYCFAIDAGAFNTTGLGHVTQLSLYSRSGYLPAGIFDQLTGLRFLDLRYNLLGSLPAGVFDKLTGLRILDLSSNVLMSLPAGVFDQLTGLTGLYLHYNKLTSLPAGVFDRLTGLRFLDLSFNVLTSIPAGVFDQLTGLTGLSLTRDVPPYTQQDCIFHPPPFNSLPAGVFDRLTSLAALYLPPASQFVCFVPIPSSVQIVDASIDRHIILPRCGDW